MGRTVYQPSTMQGGTIAEHSNKEPRSDELFSPEEPWNNSRDEETDCEHQWKVISIKTIIVSNE